MDTGRDQPDPTPRDLAVFGALLAPFGALLGGLAWWRLHAPALGITVGTVFAAAALLFLVAPRMRRPMYDAWMRAAAPVGRLVALVLLGAVYYGVLTPIGLVMRLAGRDPLGRRFEAGRASYWEERPGSDDSDRPFRQF